ncbi:hypothetical protein [Streptosporangium carneum]|uniref:Uncharacterized protein n=1 Tax=Streptosporangium carneum TaxID=47481 RepID=A0A9W6HZM7_9ACTN|nr:hypothetical protein [Streptosporangium carneum]GLK09315.1 hypothetical protein GCM10017600_27210 [Streptosporangium carneum]
MRQVETAYLTAAARTGTPGHRTRPGTASRDRVIALLPYLAWH